MAQAQHDILENIQRVDIGHSCGSQISSRSEIEAKRVVTNSEIHFLIESHPLVDIIRAPSQYKDHLSQVWGILCQR